MVLFVVVERGRLKGIDTGQGSKLLHQLFVDDIGIYLNGTKEDFIVAIDVIRTFERISGAQLNLEKYVLIQLDLSSNIDWFDRAGCKVTQPGEIVTYLGSPIGVDINFLLGKVRK